MILENKLGITDSVELAKAEEKISKKRAIELFESGYLNYLKPGTFKSLAEIHKYLFGPIYGFAGQIRTVNISKGNFRFAPIMYLEAALENIEKMPQSTYDEIIEIKYPSIRYMGGWMKIKHTNGKIRLTVVLENIGDFMYRLKEILDEGGKSNAITVSTLLSIILMIFIR